MSAIDDTSAFRDFIDIVDKDCALFRQIVDDKSVMNDLPANVNWRPKGLQGNLHHIDGANNASTKSPWL